MQFGHHHPEDDLDPRRTRRGPRTRDFASRSMSIGVPNLPQLLAQLLAQVGLSRPNS